MNARIDLMPWMIHTRQCRHRNQRPAGLTVQRVFCVSRSENGSWPQRNPRSALVRGAIARCPRAASTVELTARLQRAAHQPPAAVDTRSVLVGTSRFRLLGLVLCRLDADLYESTMARPERSGVKTERHSTVEANMRIAEGCAKSLRCRPRNCFLSRSY